MLFSKLYYDAIENIVHKVSIKNVTFDNYEGERIALFGVVIGKHSHGRVNSLSSAPYARVPQLSPVIPDWLSNFIISGK